MALDEYKPIAATASTFEADQREVNAPTDTVEGRMTGLLASDSDYMKRAETKGLQTAASRGLLNSSMAVGAAQAASIDAALPIAQQDAQTYTDTRYQNQNASNTAQQFNAGNLTDVSKTNAASQNASLLSGQNYEQQQGINTQQNAAAMELQGLQGDQTLEQQESAFGYETQLKDIDAEIAKATASQNFAYQQTLEDQKAAIESEASRQKFQADRDLAEVQSGYDVVLQSMINDADNHEQFSQYLDNSGQQLQIQVTAIRTDPDLTTAEKTTAVNDLKADYKDRTDMMASLYNDINISW